MTTVSTRSMTLEQITDALGELHEAQDGLRDREKELAAVLRKALTKRKDARIEGERYVAELLAVGTASIGDIAALHKAAGARFDECVRADVAACREILGDEAVDAIAVTKTSRRLVVSSR